MAKKVIASLQAAGKTYTKVIKCVKSPKTGAYVFKENIIHMEELKEFIEKS